MNSTTHYVQPTELDLNKAESWNFNIPGDITAGISFPENYQLSMEIAINLHLQEYASNTYEVKKGVVYKKPLDPQIYPLHVPQSTGGLFLFKGVECYFNNLSYVQNADQLQAQSMNWINKLCVLEHTMVPDINKVLEKAQLGFVSGFHEPPQFVQTGESGKFLIRASFPMYPFRNYAPYSKTKSSGLHIIPPNMNINVKLIKEDISLLNTLALLGGEDIKTNACLNKDGDDDIHQLSINDDGTVKFLKIENISWEAQNVYLMYKKVPVISKIPRDFQQTFSGYRIILSGLSTNSHQDLFLNWDVIKTPKSVILYFLRDQEVQFKKNSNTTVCPQYSFRPASLQTMTVRKSSPSGPVSLLHITGLASRDPHPSWFSYLEYLRENNFARDFVNFWKIPDQIPSAAKDRGVCNSFILDLSELKAKDVLQISLEFAQPPPPGWTLASAFVHNCEARFPLNPQSNDRRFEFQYI